MTTPRTTSTAFENFKLKLAEMFMFDQADLDFGIYRIMNAKRQEINAFLDHDLLPQVNQIVEASIRTNRFTYDTLIRSAEQQSQEERARYLRERVDNLSAEQLQSDVFTHLHTFFSRYYDKGDFISLRRINKDAYAIPYNGEEVKLHWANADQYYIKSSEYFRDYTFTLADGRRVHFKLIDADTELNNNKATANKERRFALHTDTPVYTTDEHTLVIAFTYQIQDENQEKLNETALMNVEAQLNSWHAALFAPDQNGKSVLANRLNDYTKRNTFDYFIHKNLGEFLRRELDFYVKNEMLSLDGSDASDDLELSISLTRIKAFRGVAHKIITFLAQLEDFQKKLWLKKKFVVETNYCVTLDRVPQELHGAILANDAQIDEWVKLFAIDDISGDMLKTPYSRPLTRQFLAENPFLVVDTKFFDQAFKDALLASFDDIDAACDGLLIHSENFQALNLLQARYRQQVKCIYIDPPYNTAASEIIYKNNYKHSSWNSLMFDRMSFSKNLIQPSGFIAITIDYEELFNLGKIADSIWNPENRVGLVTVYINPKGRQHERFFTSSTEYMFVYANNVEVSAFNKVTIDEEKSAEFTFIDHNGKYRLDDFARIRTSTTRQAKPRFYYPIYVSHDLMTLSLDDIPNSTAVYPVNKNGDEYSWKVIPESFIENNSKGLYVAQKTDDGIRVYNKYYEQQVLPNIWIDKKYFPEFQGTNVLKNIVGEGLFSYPKSIHAVSDYLKIVSNNNDVVMDYFAGSGTTAHAVINLFRENQSRRKYVLIEMGEYFNTVVKPRISRVIYSSEWQEKRPLKINSGVSHMFKYLRLESYEDTLNNVQLQRTPAQANMLADHDQLREQYVLGYMLDVESRGSASLLNQNAFTQPFAYTLQIAKGGSVAESVPTVVDLVETFNYLIGLRVKRMRVHAHGIRTVQGHTLDGKQTLVVWRDVSTVDDAHLWQALTGPGGYDNLASGAFDVVYVNGDTALAGRLPSSCQVRHTDAVFHALMFADTSY